MDQNTNSTEGSSLSLKEMPNLPLRAGRHLAAWIMWHTGRVSLDGTLAGQADSVLGPAKRSA